jgi:hypothetical protein
MVRVGAGVSYRISSLLCGTDKVKFGRSAMSG